LSSRSATGIQKFFRVPQIRSLLCCNLLRPIW
jgi:hypothetical protein